MLLCAFTNVILRRGPGARGVHGIATVRRLCSRMQRGPTQRRSSINMGGKKAGGEKGREREGGKEPAQKCIRLSGESRA